MKVSRRIAACLIAMGGLPVAMLVGVTQASSTTTATTAPTVSSIPAPPKSLVKAAQAEGKLSLYTSINNAPANSEEIAAFNKKYPGIQVTYLYLASTAIGTKFLANAQAGDQQADVIWTQFSSFFATAYHSGFITPLDDVIPRFKSHYPSKYVEANGVTAVASIVPNGFAYNTNLVPAADAPTTLSDFASPFWKGHLMASDPNSSVANFYIWNMIIKKLGATVAHEIWDNMAPGQTEYSGSGAMVNPLTAGEAWATPAISETVLLPALAAGAPIKYVLPSLVTGTYNVLGVATQAPDPAAAKLFAYWAYSKAGQTAINNTQHASGPLDPKTLPKDWQAPDLAVGTATYKAYIDAFLGIGPN